MNWRGVLVVPLIAAVVFAGDDGDPRADTVRTLATQARHAPDDLNLQVRLGEAALSARDYEAADAAFRAVLARKSDDPAALHGMARCMRARGRYAEARRHAQRAVDAAANASTAAQWTTLLDVLTREGTRDDAMKALDGAMALPRDRQSGLLFNVAALLAFDRGETLRANEIAAVGAERFSASTWSWSVRLWLLDVQGRDDEAASARKRLDAAVRDAGQPPPQRTQLALPLDARCRVLQGPLGTYSHVSLRNRHAWDLQPIDANGDAYRGRGEANEDHVGWDMPVLASADGIIVDVRNDVPDHEPGKPDALNAAGNYVFIDHGPGELTRYLHLRKGSVTVKVGDRVRRGERVGRLGDSGWTTKPHLCFAMVSEIPPEDATRPAVFARYTRIRRWVPLEVADGSPDTDEWIEPVSTKK